MAAVLMSNPGLHMAVLGNPKTRRNKKREKASAKKRRQRMRRKAKKTSTPFKRSNSMAKIKRNRGRRRRDSADYKTDEQFKKGYHRNPKTRRNVGSKRRNPTLAATGRQYVRGLATAPTKVMSLFSGERALRNGLWTAGGAVGAYWLGGFASTYLRPMLSKVPGLGTAMGQRIVGGLMPYTGAFLASMLVKDQQLKSSLRLGGAVASIVELIAPGKIGDLIRRLPGGETIASPVEGLWGIGEYVTAPSYAGTGEYVDAPSYAGTGEDTMLAGYVEDAGYRGAGEEMLAGNFLEDASIFQPAI